MYEYRWLLSLWRQIWKPNNTTPEQSLIQYRTRRHRHRSGMIRSHVYTGKIWSGACQGCSWTAKHQDDVWVLSVFMLGEEMKDRYSHAYKVFKMNKVWLITFRSYIKSATCRLFVGRFILSFIWEDLNCNLQIKWNGLLLSPRAWAHTSFCVAWLPLGQVSTSSLFIF